MSSDLISAPVTSDPILDGDHERFAHIVLESAKVGDGDERVRFTDVTAAYIEGTPVQALCGKVWVPSRDPKRYPICPTCREIAEGLGWRVPF